MPYLIDGHNLIPNVGLSLSSMDDEMDLVSLLQAFCRIERKQVEVYFDKAPPGQDGTRKFGSVTAHFVRQGTTADAAILKHLKRLGNAARNWTVVTSDRQVQAGAQGAHAQVFSSDEFARQMSESLRVGSTKSKADSSLTTEEVEEWLKMFRERGNKTG